MLHVMQLVFLYLKLLLQPQRQSSLFVLGVKILLYALPQIHFYFIFTSNGNILLLRVLFERQKFVMR